ncbi:MAG TPA: winged helix-turn-helix domain-containing protein [Candidatus Bathyarchaeia archaeon]|nr:winged helix-turn-helix domain-containing protein [Candidatus Bathyarchaeia archaeon]
MNKRRDATRVIHDILLLGRMGASKTQVISKANLSFPLADRYISFLLSKGHLRLGLDHRGVRRYTLTSKGERLLGFLAEIQRELEELFPNTSAAILTVAALSHGSLFDLDLRQGEG